MSILGVCTDKVVSVLPQTAVINSGLELTVAGPGPLLLTLGSLLLLQINTVMKQHPPREPATRPQAGLALRLLIKELMLHDSLL